MRINYFHIPAQHPEEASTELNQFLAQHKVVDVEQRLVECGPSSFWAVSVQWLPSGRAGRPADKAPRERIDYREVLPPDEFAVFSQLRELRKVLAAERAVSLHAIFSNEQLADMVRQRVCSKSALQGLPGVGEAKVRDYGEAVLALLQRELVSLPTVTSSDAAVDSNETQ